MPIRAPRRSWATSAAVDEGVGGPLKNGVGAPNDDNSSRPYFKVSPAVTYEVLDPQGQPVPSRMRARLQLESVHPVARLAVVAAVREAPCHLRGQRAVFDRAPSRVSRLGRPRANLGPYLPGPLRARGADGSRFVDAAEVSEVVPQQKCSDNDHDDH